MVTDYDAALAAALAVHEAVVRAADEQLRRDVRHATRLELGRMLSVLGVADEDVAGSLVARWANASPLDLQRDLEHLRQLALALETRDPELGQPRVTGPNSSVIACESRAPQGAVGNGAVGNDGISMG